MVGKLFNSRNRQFGYLSNLSFNLFILWVQLFHRHMSTSSSVFNLSYNKCVFFTIYTYSAGKWWAFCTDTVILPKLTTFKALTTLWVGHNSRAKTGAKYLLTWDIDIHISDWSATNDLPALSGRWKVKNCCIPL